MKSKSKLFSSFTWIFIYRWGSPMFRGHLYFKSSFLIQIHCILQRFVYPVMLNCRKSWTKRLFLRVRELSTKTNKLGGIWSHHMPIHRMMKPRWLLTGDTSEKIPSSHFLMAAHTMTFCRYPWNNGRKWPMPIGHHDTGMVLAGVQYSLTKIVLLLVSYIIYCVASRSIASVPPVHFG